MRYAVLQHKLLYQKIIIIECDHHISISYRSLHCNVLHVHLFLAVFVLNVG